MKNNYALFQYYFRQVCLWVIALFPVKHGPWAQYKNYLRVLFGTTPEKYLKWIQQNKIPYIRENLSVCSMSSLEEWLEDSEVMFFVLFTPQFIHDVFGYELDCLWWEKIHNIVAGNKFSKLRRISGEYLISQGILQND
ncbi:MAG: hypothetical protein MR839_07775 [Spirochaetia bacterium]|nr:hypothetical protein [Spirochaetia bacterium]